MGDSRLLRSRFGEDYGTSLKQYALTLQTQEPEMVIALARKGRRLLDVMARAGLALPTVPIISEGALNLINPGDLPKKLLLTDDIVILGTTVDSVLDELSKRFDRARQTVPIAPFCVDESYWLESLAPVVPSTLRLSRQDSTAIYLHVQMDGLREAVEKHPLSAG